MIAVIGNDVQAIIQALSNSKSQKKELCINNKCIPIRQNICQPKCKSSFLFIVDLQQNIGWVIVHSKKLKIYPNIQIIIAYHTQNPINQSKLAFLKRQTQLEFAKFVIIKRNWVEQVRQQIVFFFNQCQDSLQQSQVYRMDEYESQQMRQCKQVLVKGFKNDEHIFYKLDRVDQNNKMFEKYVEQLQWRVQQQNMKKRNIPSRSILKDLNLF